MGYYATKVRKNHVRQYVHNCGREKAAFILRGNTADRSDICLHTRTASASESNWEKAHEIDAQRNVSLKKGKQCDKEIHGERQTLNE